MTVEPLFTFAHVADTHLWSPANTHVSEAERILCNHQNDVVTPLVQSLNAATDHPRPDLVVFAGDNIFGDYNDFAMCEIETRLLKERLDWLEIPYAILSHNHDTWGEDAVSSHMICNSVWTPPPGHVWREPYAGTQYRRFFGEGALCYTREMPGDFVCIFMSEQYVEPETGLFITLDAKLGWLDERLREASGKRVLLFTHVPLMWPRHTRTHDLWPADTDAGGKFMLDHRAAFRVRELLARHGNVIEHYSGHTHVHSHLQSEGTHFVGTAGLYNEPAEYRLVRVMPGQIAHQCVHPAAVGVRPQIWKHCVDDLHPTTELFHAGLPHERDFVIEY
ncbi:MAG: metallophosphoesterase [Lentisphaerae bacterium]|nr:metallophosphoesterase [Lentisphaerota bacterium]